MLLHIENSDRATTLPPATDTHSSRTNICKCATLYQKTDYSAIQLTGQLSGRVLLNLSTINGPYCCIISKVSLIKEMESIQNRGNGKFL